jgi:hypothetical protein
MAIQRLCIILIDCCCKLLRYVLHSRFITGWGYTDDLESHFIRSTFVCLHRSGNDGTIDTGEDFVLGGEGIQE